MSRKSKRKRSPVPSRSVPVVPSLPVASEPAKGRIRQAGARLFNSAVDTTLENFWIYFWSLIGGAIGPTLMAILVGIILYLRAPESAWVYTLLKYAFVFLAGTLLPMLVLVLLALVGVYRKKRREKDRVHKYASTEKAWVDFEAELGPAISRFASPLQEIGRETIQVGVRSAEMIQAILISDPQLRRRLMSRRAKALNKHCLRMEVAGEQLIEARDAFFEVAEGILKSTPPASQGNGLKLEELRDTLALMNDSAATVIQTQRELIEKSKAVHGQVSQDVNTSMNWLIAVCEHNIRVIEGFKVGMSQSLFPLLQQKLDT